MRNRSLIALICIFLSTLILSSCDLNWDKSSRNLSVVIPNGGTQKEKVATPTFDVKDGRFVVDQNVGISCSTSDVTVYYTTDGSDPTTFSNIYSKPIVVSGNNTITTIRTFAVKEGMNDSYVASATYYINYEQLDHPVFYPTSGSFSEDTDVTITAAAGAIIYYTLDGKTPTTFSDVYSEPIHVVGDGSSVVIKAMAVKDQMESSTTATENYVINYNQVSTPQFSVSGGTYNNDQSVEITCSTANAEFYYTINESAPSESSTHYSGAITVSTGTTIKVIAIKNMMQNSTVANATYVLQVATPTISPASGSVLSGTQVTITSTTINATIRYTTNNDTPNESSTLYNPSSKPTITSATTFKVIAFKDGYNPSDVVSASFVNSIIYVKQSATGSNNGSNWDNAFTDLNLALETAILGVEVWVASGTYYPSSYHDIDPGSPENPRLKHFHLKKGVAIYGGFAGLETTRAERNFETNVTTISGDIGVAGNVADNVYHLFYHPASIAIDNTAILDGVVISKGNANASGTGAHSKGAGIYNEAGSPHISNVVFEYNRAVYGGAIYNNIAPDVIIEHSTFIANYSSTKGGAIHNYHSTGEISFSSFEANIGVPGNSVGAAMFNESSDMLISDSEFKDHGIVSDYAVMGGAILDSTGKLEIIRSSFENNHASASGGAVFGNGSDLTVDSCTFTSNWCAYDGGAIYAQGATNTVVIKDSTFTGNYTTANSNGGGAIKLYGLETADISGSVFAKNTTKGGGGGISVDHSQDINISYSTFYANKRLAASLGSTTSGMGGAILVNSSNVDVSNNIFWANLAYSPEKGNDLYIYNDTYPPPQILSTVNIENNNIQLLSGIGNDIGGNMEVDPLFIDAVGGDYNLNSESLCIDMGAYPISD